MAKSGEEWGEPAVEKPFPWLLYVDRVFDPMSAGAGVVLKGPRGIKLEYTLKILFKASNNAVKYEAMIAGLNLAKEIKPKTLIIYSDSQLVINQIEGQFATKDGDTLKYLTMATGIA